LIKLSFDFSPLVLVPSKLKLALLIYGGAGKKQKIQEVLGSIDCLEQ
jgi:hypothetical protein